jgi:hypothetical protein
MDACQGFVVLIVAIFAIGGAIKLYVMVKHPDLYLKWQQAEQEKKLMEEQRKAIRDAHIGNAAKIGWWVTRMWLGDYPKGTAISPKACEAMFLWPLSAKFPGATSNHWGTAHKC